MNPTIKDVAKKANVSIATVSRIINGQQGYTKKTKEKVLNAISELGYQPNAIARGLINKKTNTIGVLLPDVSSMFAAKLLNGIEELAHEHDYSVIVCNTDSNGVRTMKYLQVLNEKRVDGIIFTSEVMTDDYYKAIKQMKIPTVLVSSISYQYNLPYVKVDDRHAAYSATEYLIKNGHRKIGMISGPKKDPIAGLPRVQGYQQALHENQIFLDDSFIIYGDSFGHETGQQCFLKLLLNNPDITACFCASDEMAVGALSAAYNLGVKIPDEISIIGYDNIKIAEMSIPPLTTVEQPLIEIGKTAFNMIYKMISTDSEIVESRIMPHKIIERKTVKSLERVD